MAVRLFQPGLIDRVEDVSRSRSLATALSIIFFLSGGASLLFETLWFRLSGLVFGNGAWASAIVLASFMTGLALGNVLSVRLARRTAQPLMTYGLIEIGIGVVGFSLVVLLPRLPAILAPVFRLLIDSSMLNGARLLFAFILLLVPSTLMGATLPTIVSALSHRDPNFGRVLALLYGFNTIGAVTGALLGEMLLIRLFGVRGTGLAAALGSITAGVSARALARRGSTTTPRVTLARTSRVSKPLLAAAFASGFALLALEVIWFRFIVLFVISNTIAFAVMLAVVLAGIGVGALLASAALSRMPDADQYASIVAACAAAALVLSYSGFAAHPARFAIHDIAVDSLRLMLPVSILSGILFPLIGRAIERQIGDELRAAAFLTAANTVGAAIGPVLAAFVFIPMLGIERSLFAVAVLYVAIAALAVRPATSRLALSGAAVLAIATLALFPFRLFANYFLPHATTPFRGSRIAAVREGPIETAVLLRSDVASDPYIYRLFTNGYSMSATTFASKRYMSAFVYLPLALRPHARNALLISYGVGVTAKRLTQTKQFDSIDVVDISKTILNLSSVIWPGASNPLRDPRVRAHVEDGRFFLLTSPRRFDLITAEPPPPKSAGIVNLYTREYFRMMYDRLSDEGIASYWLPAYQLYDADNRAVIRAFCDVFRDCSLWSGAAAEFILIGSRTPIRAPSYDEFAAQWRDPVVGSEMVRLGFESPEELAATFLADAPMLQRMTLRSPPLVDDYPLRLSAEPAMVFPALVQRLMQGAPSAFMSSQFVRDALPAQVRAGAPQYFRAQQLLNGLLYTMGPNRQPSTQAVRSVLVSTPLRTLPRLLFGTDAWLEDIAARARARGDRSSWVPYILAIGALSDRDYDRAAALFGEARKAAPPEKLVPQYEQLALSLRR